MYFRHFEAKTAHKIPLHVYESHNIVIVWLPLCRSFICLILGGNGFSHSPVVVTYTLLERKGCIYDNADNFNRYHDSAEKEIFGSKYCLNVTSLTDTFL